jgi:hypothetical protein
MTSLRCSPKTLVVTFLLVLTVWLVGCSQSTPGGVATPSVPQLGSTPMVPGSPSIILPAGQPLVCYPATQLPGMVQPFPQGLVGPACVPASPPLVCRPLVPACQPAPFQPVACAPATSLSPGSICPPGTVPVGCQPAGMVSDVPVISSSPVFAGSSGSICPPGTVPVGCQPAGMVNEPFYTPAPGVPSGSEFPPVSSGAGPQVEPYPVAGGPDSVPMESGSGGPGPDAVMQ